jgi:hypothetical protein
MIQKYQLQSSKNTKHGEAFLPKENINRRRRGKRSIHQGPCPAGQNAQFIPTYPQNKFVHIPIGNDVNDKRFDPSNYPHILENKFGSLCMTLPEACIDCFIAILSKN